MSETLFSGDAVKTHSNKMQGSNSHYEEIIKFLFEKPGKMVKRIPKKYLKSYKKLYLLLSQELGTKLPEHSNYLGNNELARTIYERKYYLKDPKGRLLEKRPEDVFLRLATFIAAVESSEDLQIHWAKKFYGVMYHGYFIPGGRVIAGAGDLLRLKTLANCFVSTIPDDSIEGIYQAAMEAARTYSYGGGIGIDMSVLRPKDTPVHNAADRSTGAVSFMELYSLTTGLIGQAGRRGALMLMLDVKHPDAFEFIRVKQVPNWITKQVTQQCQWSGEFTEEQLRTIEKTVRENTQIRFANISLKITDEFMAAVNEAKSYPSSWLLYETIRVPRKDAYQNPQEGLHYSQGIPSKDISVDKLIKVFSSFAELQQYVEDQFGVELDKNDVMNPKQRDVHGDYFISTSLDSLEDLGSSSTDVTRRYFIRRAGDFMLYFAMSQTGEIRRLVNALDLWNEFIASNYRTAEPGMVFWDRMTRYSPSNYVGRPITCTNPCAEVPLEDGGACNLGSINLSRMVDDGYTDKARINWDRLKSTVATAVRLLDNVVTWNEYLNPLEKQRVAARETRRLGLGIMGIADMLNQLGLAYDSPEALTLMDRVMSIITNTAFQTSSQLAVEKGPSPIFNFEAYAQCPFYKEALTEETKAMIKENALRNIAIMSIAPTGSISNIVLGFEHDDRHYIGVSGGIEPIFALYYTRRSESFDNQFFKVFHPTVQAYLDLKGLQQASQSARSEEDLRQLLPAHFFRTAHHVKPEFRVKMQAVCQKYIDHSISSTINLPEDVHPEMLSRIYFMAWKEGLKGVTVYRAGSRFPILSVEGQKTEFQKFKEKTFVIRDKTAEKIFEVSGDEPIVLPDGSLTTIYHLVKEHRVQFSAS